MRIGLRVFGAMAMSWAAPQLASAQSSSVPPPPGTPVAPLNLPAHIAPSPLERGDKPVGRKIVNTTNVQIDYRIDTVGPSGVGRVNIYMTPDRGQSWVKLGEDADKQSPAHVALPGDGVYGIRLAIVNGNGFGGRAPHAGDRPQFSVEVDSSAPHVALQTHTMVPNQGAIDIRWTALDANLTAEPVNLYFRTHPEAGWQPIARNLKNEGAYRWTLPRDIAAQVYLKVEATDRAGNTATAESPTPIILDQTEPEATLVDVTPSQRGRSNVLLSVSLGSVPAAPAELPPATIPRNLPASLPTLP